MHHFASCHALPPAARHRLRVMTFAAAAAWVPLTALAVPTVELVASSAVSQVAYHGGFAVVADSGTDGSLTPVTSLPPQPLALDGSHQFIGHYSYWDFSYDVTWSQFQSGGMSVDPAAGVVFQSAGRTELTADSVLISPTGTSTITVGITSTNTLSMDFTLSEATAFEFAGTTTGGQYALLSIWSDHAGRFVGLPGINPLTTGNRSFDFSGSLNAGLYRLSANIYGLTADASPPTINATWDYSITLPAAVATAVPEPHTPLLWLAGLWVLFVSRRRTAPGTEGLR